MKPDYDKIRSVSNLARETQVMTLDENSLHHLMSVLTDLYSDPRLAVIREYSTNAFDATVDAGSSEPVLITLPHAYAPNFTIQDFGTGMTTDEVLHTYSQYGNSTKRESDEVTGMLGVGCKSGLTYTNSFIVTTVKNGIKTVANVTKNSDQIGEIQIIDTAKSSERNGTTIQIPVKSLDIDAFGVTAREFFRFWQPGTVLIDGSAPEFFVNSHEGFTQFGTDENIYYSAGYGNRHTLVMGNVAYPLNMNTDLGNLIIFAPIGAVNFAPSREELSYRGKTDRYIETIQEKIKAEKAWIIKNAVNAAKSKPEAMKIATELRSQRWFQGNQVYYNGEIVPDWPRARHSFAGTAWSSRIGWNGKNTQIDRNPSYIHPGTVIIKGNVSSLSADHKYGLREKYGKDRYFFITEAPEFVNNPWIAVEGEWKDVKKTLSKRPVGNVTSTGVSNVDRTGRNFAILDREGDFTGDYVEQNDKRAFFAFTPSDRPDKYRFSRLVKVGLTPVQVYKADIDAFRKTYKTYKSIEEFATEVMKNADRNTKITYYLSRHFVRDEGVRALSKSLDTGVASMVDLDQDKMNTVTMVARYAKDTECEKAARHIAGKYPMLGNSGASEKDQLDYINALYTTRKDS